MAHDLYARLMHETDDYSYPDIAIHQFFAILNEYARKVISKDRILEVYLINGSDDLVNSMFGFIDKETTITNRLIQSKTIEDCFMIHENSDTRELYPDKESLRNRIGI